VKSASAAPARRLVDDRDGSVYLGISRSQFRNLVSAGRIPRVVVPAEDGRPLRRLLVDLNDLSKLVDSWKQR
jgi:regulator of extracellular matrix RemA (YlzA/DUF370 family)